VNLPYAGFKENTYKSVSEPFSENRKTCVLCSQPKAHGTMPVCSLPKIHHWCP